MPGSAKPETPGRLSLPVTAGYSHATALPKEPPVPWPPRPPTAEAKEKLVNDRPSSGLYPDSGYDGLSNTAFAGESPYVSYETQGQGYDYASSYPSYETGAYDSTAWSAQDGYAQDADYLSTIPAQGGVPEDTGTGQWDASAWNQQSGAADYQATALGYEQTGQWAMPGHGTTGTETGAYDATAWNTVPQHEQQTQTFSYEHHPYEYQEQPYQEQHQETAYAYEAPAAEGYSETAVFEVLDTAGIENADSEPSALDLAPEPVHDLPTQAMPVTLDAAPAPRVSRRAGAKTKPAPAAAATSRRRTPAKRSALLTVAVPSACVMGVAGVAAASVGGLTGTDKPAEGTTTMAAPDPASVKPVAANSKLDTQLTALSADAGDFADRASRTQERIDLRQRQDDEKKRKAEEEAAKEAARPKFAIPVEQHGLSASFGQAGGMWMSVHTGIDFPVSYGTPVMSATDGTVRTQWNSAYGNMAIVTSPDGTETWYCHLSSTKIRSGKVKAGDVIAYSGNSGNSTGPHLHFEVRPGGGSAIDPLPWLRSHGLDPT
ncbi:M23 family metallopeptidase [Streptomyces flavotricini]|uniref:M23 family metallopeptidase n=1 Tax=Streptomyces flavotricini TaxID=66888 RepID=A0ABS8E656_9ACTN|nr:M23 family metallopeptidase [Streptomyces flavotricini]